MIPKNFSSKKVHQISCHKPLVNPESVLPVMLTIMNQNLHFHDSCGGGA